MQNKINIHIHHINAKFRFQSKFQSNFQFFNQSIMIPIVFVFFD